MPGLRDRPLSDYEAIALSSRQIALTMAQRALSLKADDVVVLDLRKLSFSFDFFVLCSGSSDRRIRTVAEDIEEDLAAQGVHLGHVEGRREGVWLLLDYGPVVVHIFSPEVRRFYDLERLWGDAPRLRISKKRHSNHP